MPKPDDMRGEPPEAFVLAGGSPYSRGDKVTPGVLSAVPVSYSRGDGVEEQAIPTTMSGRRLALARWIANPDNPLSTRSIVNRVWQYHFGKGIAGNANNFGKMGKKPTHPELLDWLSGRFVEEGWSLKKLHRRIMTSAAYRRGDRLAVPAAVSERDPNNDLLSYFRPRRLTAEEIRDSMLFAVRRAEPGNRRPGGLSGSQPRIRLATAHEPNDNHAGLSAFADPRRAQPAFALCLPHADADRSNVRGLQSAELRYLVRTSRQLDRHAAGVQLDAQRQLDRPVDRHGTPH